MRKSTFILVCLFILPVASRAQYLPQSVFINEPGKAREFVKEVADFHKQAEDTSGGYHSFLMPDGSPKEQQPGGWPGYEYKSFCSISRLAYAFNRAFMLTGDTAYLYDARHALRFLYEKGYDTENGGWHFTYNMDEDRSWGPPWSKDTKWTFQQQYALVGIISMVEATGGDKNWHEETPGDSDLAWFNRGIDLLYEQVWDDDPDYYGYFENAANDWSSRSGKGFTGTIDGINTHAALAALMFPVPRYLDRFRELADIARDHLAGNMDAPGVKAGFPGSYNDQWQIKTGNTSVSIGHMLKAAWCLGRAALVFEDDSYALAAEQILDQVWETNHPGHDNLYDHSYGGPFDGADWSTGEVTKKTKNHWVLEQGFTGPMINYYIAGDPERKDAYMQMADESIDFFEKHAIDKTNGCSWLEVSRDGSVITSNVKADNFKAGFHDAELGYIAYLYSSAYAHQKPFELYYYFEAREQQRVVKLTPLAMKEGQLKISGVSLHGNEFTSFDPGSRELTVPPGEGGVFRVTFSPGTTQGTPGHSIARAPGVRVFPNPFTSRLTAVISLQQRQKVSASMLDLSGRVVDRFYSATLPAGRHSIQWQPDGTARLSPGVYLLRLNTGTSQVIKRIIYQEQ